MSLWQHEPSAAGVRHSTFPDAVMFPEDPSAPGGCNGLSAQSVKCHRLTKERL